MSSAKLPPSAGVDSYDIMPALVGEKRDRPIREATVLHSGSGKFAIRQGGWVLIDAATGDDNHAQGEPQWFKKDRGYTPNLFPGELYNLHDDIVERRNLYGEKPQVVQRLKTLLEKYKADGRSTPGPQQPNTPANAHARTASIPDENPPTAVN